ESDQADIAVRITQGETVARQLKVTPGENIVRLAAGRYVVEIEGEHDGLTVENDRVMLARGKGGGADCAGDGGGRGSRRHSTNLQGLSRRGQLSVGSRVFPGPAARLVQAVAAAAGDGA